MRGVRNGVLALALIVLAAAYLAYWYVPRERPGAPAAGSLVAGLLQSSDLPLRAWVAHPHQNLAFLVLSGSGENWRRGLAALIAVPEIDLPGFGPFPLPPAHGMAVASDEAGERLVAAASVYPTIAVLARLAGRLAGNPWLAGGEVEHGKRRFEVRWAGRVWMLRTPGEEWPRALTGASPVAALVRLAVDRPLGPLPAGSYRLVRSGAHLDLVSAGVEGTDAVRPARGVLMMAEGAPPGPRATAVLGPGQGSLRGLPSAVTFARQGTMPPALPFARLYRVLGVERRRATVEGWQLVASDRLALSRGRELLPAVRTAALGREHEVSYSADLDVVRAVSAELEARLAGLPLPDFEELRRWRGAARLLAELGSYDAWSLEVAAGGAEARARLWHAD
ncbi:MAG: hypothetical protein OES32_05015 [Acidobacteriota bacterium]|nr:hypothetical protein [Acidobacteriota bacterium]